MRKSRKDYVVFILSHGRPDKVITIKTLEKMGYTGDIIIVIDNEDSTAEKYRENFGEEMVYMFDKKATSKTFDEFDNFDNRKAIVYARNECFAIAKELGYRYFMQFDDDYTSWLFRIDGNLEHPKSFFTVRTTLDDIFRSLLDFFKSIPQVHTIATSQGGDWFGGDTQFGKKPKRKSMNTFICDTERPFKFVGRINEDVNTYTSQAAKGFVTFTVPHIQMDQVTTQASSGGMTETYLDGGTYIKSFYTIICAPNCTEITLMGRTQRRLHHRVKWNHAAPMIISEKHKK